MFRWAFRFIFGWAIGWFGGGKPPPHKWALDTRVVPLNDRDSLCLSDLCEGVQVFGGTGSGKTSGSGRVLAEALMRLGAGFLVLTAKGEEVQRFRQYSIDAGREDDLIIFGEHEPWRFNALNYENTRTGPGGGITQNIVSLLATLTEVIDRKKGDGKGQEAFWHLAATRMERALIDILKHSVGDVSIPYMHKLLVSAPTSIEMVHSPAWKDNSLLWACIEEGRAKALSQPDALDFEAACDYFIHSYPALGDRTRMSIVEMVMGVIDVFNHAPLRELFATETNFTPEAILDGKIVIMALPLKQYHEAGLYAQVVMKYMTQRAIERRDVSKNDRPCVIFADEAHLFALSRDVDFQTTARSVRAISIYLTQSYSNYLSSMGGDNARASVDSLLASMQVKIFHQSSDSVTNNWASELLGKTRKWMSNCNSSYEPADMIQTMTGMRGPPRNNAGASEQLMHELEPSVFTTLAKGGHAHKFAVEAVVYGGGRVWKSTGKSYLYATFHQEF